MMMQQQKKKWGIGWMLLVGLLAPILLFTQPSIPQDALYHEFSDRRVWLGIPNFWDVVSNVPFTIVGLMGLMALTVPGKLQILHGLKPAYVIFFFGIALVGFGSGYYHLNPNNFTLVWDRLPMTIAFMAFVAIVVGEHGAERWAKWLLFPLILFGMGSVLYWWLTEQRGVGDLRWYALVQFLPMLMIPAILLCFRSCFDRIQGYWWLLACYVLAKGLEHFDQEIFNALGVIGGHALKHLAAALGVWLLLRAYERRRRYQAPEHLPGEVPP